MLFWIARYEQYHGRERYPTVCDIGFAITVVKDIRQVTHSFNLSPTRHVAAANKGAAATACKEGYKLH